MKLGSIGLGGAEGSCCYATSVDYIMRIMIGW